MEYKELEKQQIENITEKAMKEKRFWNERFDFIQEEIMKIWPDAKIVFGSVTGKHRAGSVTWDRRCKGYRIYTYGKQRGGWNVYEYMLVKR